MQVDQMISVSPFQLNYSLFYSSYSLCVKKECGIAEAHL